MLYTLDERGRLCATSITNRVRIACRAGIRREAAPECGCFKLVDWRSLAWYEWCLSIKTGQSCCGRLTHTSLFKTTDACHRRSVMTPCACSELANRSRRRIRLGQELGLDKHWNDSSGRQTKGPVANDIKDRANCAAMRGHGNPSVVVVSEYIVQQGQHSLFMRTV